MLDTAGEEKMNSLVTFSSGPLNTDEQVLDKLKLIYSSSAWTQDVVLKTCWKRWMIKTSGEGESRKFVLEARHDDDD